MAIQGSLREASLPDVIQLLFLGRRTGCLAVADRQSHASVFFEDGWLYAHRSWSGICRYMIRIDDNADGTARVGETWVNMKERMTLSKDYDVRLVRYLVERTLGNEWPFPT